MGIFDSSAVSTTDLDNTVQDYSVSPKVLDYVDGEEVHYHYFSDVQKKLGYFTSIPELRAALISLATYVVGKGYETDNSTKLLLDNIIGWGKDTAQSIIESLLIIKKIVGDSFAEVVREESRIINLKPISPERVRLVLATGNTLKRYDIQVKGKWVPFELNEILHLCNDRIADEIHGTSIIDSCQWVIDARHEALTDERKIKHRELALGVLYIDEDNTTKRDEIKKKYAEAVKSGEVLVLPKDVAELKDSGVNPKDRLAWIQYLENFFYQICGVPRVIATSENYTEAASKVGYLTFEPVYTREQTLLEKDLWNQLAIKIKFNRPASLGGTIQEDEEKNTGQVGFQPKETEATVERE